MRIDYSIALPWACIVIALVIFWYQMWQLISH